MCPDALANLYRIFEETVHRFGDRVAVEVQRTDTLDRYTYRDLHGLALDRAARLASAGVRPGDRCAILAHNDAHWCAAYLAILGAGAVVVPFDTNYNAGQVATILRDSGARVLFASERLRSVAEAALSELDDAPPLTTLGATGGPDGMGSAAPRERGLANDGATPLTSRGATGGPDGMGSAVPRERGLAQGTAPPTPSGPPAPALRAEGRLHGPDAAVPRERGLAQGTAPPAPSGAPAPADEPPARPVLLDVHAPAVDTPDRSVCDAGRAADASTTAVILYTSGTTSDPKGVMLSHANLIAERDAAFAVVNVGASDSVLGVLPLFHSLAQLANLLLPFAVGARVVYLETLSSQELVRALSERQITIFACVPQFFYLIHERIMREVSKRGALARLVFRALLATSFRARRVGVNPGPFVFARIHALMGRQMRLFVTGGSRFDPAIGRDLYALGFTILQAYGLTETSGAATINTPDEAHIDTVGRPLPGMELKILPADGDNPDGEIALRGPLVMQGYFNRPDATAAVMRDGWFLTGDLGRADASGRLTITGRKKEMIVLANGKNLYPEEIEAHYRTSSFVKEICVTTTGGDGKAAHERLYAVVVPDMEVLRQKKIVNAGDLLRFEMEGLSAGLPSYKRVLGYEVSFDPLPRTTTGKLKRHEIERRLREAGTATIATAPAAGDAAWCDDAHVRAALDVVRRRGVDLLACRRGANLELDLGLDSMERVELLTDLEQAFAVKVLEAQSHQIFTLGQLIEAVRPGTAIGSSDGLRESAAEAGGRAHSQRPGAVSDESWAVLLRDLPPESDPVLSGLLTPRPMLEPLLFGLGRVLPRLMGGVRVTGLEHLPRTGAFLICPNHQSYVDPFFLAAVLPYRTLTNAFFVGAVEYFETPLMAWVARKINCVPVDPDSNLVPAMKAGAFGLAHGKVLILFPEGERSIDGTVKRFKKGAPLLSRHMRVPVVPVAIRGAHEVWPRGRSFNWRGMLPWSRARVRIQFGEPIQFADGDTYADAANGLRDAVHRMWQDL